VPDPVHRRPPGARWARCALFLALAITPCVVAGATDAPQPAPPETPPGPDSGNRSWSVDGEAYFYFLDGGGDFVMPIVAADRGSLHLEGRYQYEDFDTASLWVGWNFATGSRLHLELVPMVGVVFGNTDGAAPGLEATLSWKTFELYSENEYVFDAEGAEGDFFYSWSQLSWQALSWLTVGLSTQRTRMYDSELAIDRGLFATVAAGAVEISLFGFDLDGEDPFAILSVGLSF
jgi:hypothetical protein